MVLLIEGHCEMANPLMARLIERGPLWFVLVKYAMTAVGVPVILLFKDHGLFRTRFRVAYLLPIFVGLYLLLLVYQFALLRAAPGWNAGADWPGRAVAGEIGELAESRPWGLARDVRGD